MKFMSRGTFKNEMKIAQIEGDETEKRGVNWMVISFAIIISILLVGVLALTFLPNDLFKVKNGSSGIPDASKQQQ